MKKLNILPLALFLHATFIFSQQTQLSEQLKSHVAVLASDSLEGRGLGTDGKIRAKHYIINQFGDAGVLPYFRDYLHHFKFKQNLAWIPGYNIVGIVEGNDPVLKNEYIILGAHYDHLGYNLRNGSKEIFPGADDNASGVASIIELGRYFAANSDKLKRSILLVAFDAEESGLIGSGQLVSDTLFNLSRVKIMFSLDMVGMYATHNGVDLKGVETLKGGGELARITARQTGTKLKTVDATIVRRTDTAPFGNKGIPSIHIHTGLKSPYHKPGDKYHLLDYEGMVLVNLFLREFVTQLAQVEELESDPKLINSADTLTDAKKPAFIKTGLILNMGTGFHKYKSEFFRAKPLFSGSIGLYSTVRVTRYLALQPELLFDYNGSKHANGNIRRYSITVPLNLQIGISPGGGSDDFRLYTFIGGYYRYHLAGTWGSNTINFGDVYNVDELGISTGIGINVSKITVGWTLRQGLTDLTKSSKLFDTGNSLTLGLRF